MPAFHSLPFKVHDLINGLAQHVVVDLLVESHVGEEPTVFVFELADRLAIQVFKLPAATGRAHTLNNSCYS